MIDVKALHAKIGELTLERAALRQADLANPERPSCSIPFWPGDIFALVLAVNTSAVEVNRRFREVLGFPHRGDGVAEGKCICT